MFVLILVPDEGIEARGRHECSSDGFDLFHISKFIFIQEIIKIADELVEDAEELLAAHVGLIIELVEVDEACEHDADIFVIL